MVRAAEPSLRANRPNSLEQRGATRHIKMRHNIIKKQHRRTLQPPRLKPCMRQNHGNQKRLLLAC